MGTQALAQSDLIPDGGTKDLGRRTVRGGAVIFGTMILRKPIALAIMAALARLLAPEDYGLLGMVFAFTAFLQVFADMGLSLATVQKAELTLAQVSTVFWVNLAFSVVLAGLAAASAPAVAWFYGEPRLATVMLWISLGFALAGLGTQHTALLMRRMQFGRIAACDTASLLVGGGVGIWMAFNGFGVYALVGQTLAQIATRTAFAWILTGWAPGLPMRGSGVRGMLRFGGYLTGFNILNYFARNMDKVLLGYFWGTAAVGLYTRAYSLMILPIGMISGPMGSVMIPALSKLQTDHVRFREAYLRGLRIIALVSFPLMAGLFVTASDVIAVVFGPRWVAAVPIFRLLCIAGFWQGIYNSAGQVYAGTGRTDRMFRYGMVGSPVLIAGIAVGVSWGARGTAFGYVSAMTIILAPFLSYTYATIGLSLADAARRIAAPFLASMAMACVVWVVCLTLDRQLGPSIRVCIAAMVGVGTYVALMVVFRQASVREAFGPLRSIMRLRKEGT